MSNSPCSAGIVRPECLMTIKEAVSGAVDKSIEPVASKVDMIHSRLFVDNGKPSMQTINERLTVQTKFQWWLIGIIIAAMGGLFVKTWDNGSLAAENGKMIRSIEYEVKTAEKK